MEIRPIVPADRDPLVELLRRIDAFSPREREVALELIDGALQNPGPEGYQCLLASAPDGQGGSTLVGYVCFGKTPMTRHTYDMYWIAVDPSYQGRGIGARLLDAMVARVVAAGGRGVRVETSSTEGYGRALRFYLNRGFRIMGRIPHFYREGDDLVILFWESQGDEASSSSGSFQGQGLTWGEDPSSSGGLR